MSDDKNSMSGFSSREAQEFHKYFMLGFIVFTVIAIVAHFLVWQWRPWLPGPDGYAAITDGANAVVQSAIARFS
jgi:light-harvesting complex 1 beta chain